MEIKTINCGLLGTNCYILTEGTDAVVFDPDGEKEKIYSLLEGFDLKAVILTHGHFDHTGGNGWFKKAYMHPLAVKDAKRPFGGDASQWKLDYEIETLEEGRILDLGNRGYEPAVQRL